MTKAELAHPVEDVPIRRRTRAKLALIPPPVKDIPTRRRTRAELGFYSAPIANVPRRRILRAELVEDVLQKTKTRVEPQKNLYAKYTHFPWGPRKFNSDTEFSRGRNAWGTSTNTHTKKIQETYKKLLGTPLLWELAKDWKRTCDLIFIHKKAYILYQWYQLSDEQKRVYLELQGQECNVGSRNKATKGGRLRREARARGKRGRGQGARDTRKQLPRVLREAAGLQSRGETRRCTREMHQRAEKQGPVLDIQDVGWGSNERAEKRRYIYMIPGQGCGRNKLPEIPISEAKITITHRRYPNKPIRVSEQHDTRTSLFECQIKTKDKVVTLFPL
ncbi:hypothetical protein BGX38DRAFT_1279027 [Terfezia claveryi]|nr:hypothetical protein BGX38DRAFT_1279027 [Terfezia claveryi]